MNRFLQLLVVCSLATAACSSTSESTTDDDRKGAAATGAAGSTTAPPPATEGRPYEFTVATETFVDTSRPTTDAEGVELAADRTLLTDVYVPQGAGPFPLIVFSHGALGHPRKFTELLAVWAAKGYVVAAPRFPMTSDEADPYVLGDVVNQPADVTFVMTEVLESVTVADPEHIGVAGLSLGGVTTYGVAYHDCCRDDRIDAVIVMSGARLPYEDGEYRFGGVPYLVMHGTADPVIPFTEAETAYSEFPPPKYLVTLHDGSHAAPYENTPSPHDDIVTRTSSSFWDTYLYGDDNVEPQIVHDASVSELASARSEL